MKRKSDGQLVVVCPGCGGNQSAHERLAVERFSGERFDVKRCANCGLVFTTPPLSAAELSRYYPSCLYPTDPIVELKLDVLRGFAPQAGSLLDVGCGRGDFLVAAKLAGWRVTGVEVAESSLAALRAKAVSVYSAVEALPGCPSFDVVTLWHSLEHLSNPREVMRAVRARLRHDGYLVVAVPNIDSLQARVFGGSWYHLDVPRHRVHFSPSSLQNLLVEERFRIERIIWDVPRHNWAGWVGSVACLFGSYRRFRRLSTARKLTKPLYWVYGATLMAGWLPFRAGKWLETRMRRAGTFVVVARRLD